MDSGILFYIFYFTTIQAVLQMHNDHNLVFVNIFWQSVLKIFTMNSIIHRNITMA